MSQKLLSEYFGSNAGCKRKFDEIEGIIKEETNEETLALSDRAAIIALAKVKPALSANIGLSWFRALEREFRKDYFDKLGEYLVAERKKYTVYPPEKDVFFWTNTCKISDVKVVILGQDPYHGPKQAHGLAFSVRKGVPCPPSLLNIYKELSTDINGFKNPQHGYLYGWAAQGVLLLNTCLTVRAGNANSHQHIEKDGGWEKLTDSVITWLNSNLSNVVFMLWGGNAKQKINFINSDKHLILTAAHPSPLSAHRGFLGCGHFSKANEYLKKHNKKPIDWSYLP
ncbi:uracil-DNA glycosylase-like [Uloborus diversus]|uniref:uracil-DNA glycosylase-like n=1 Tax=Uloborus diversus TaxID=327109 RepID=UPI00240A4990|nr:uracil-DNA glycosylase-like [Uloborus diversus]